MNTISLESAEIYVVELPMTEPFTVSFGTVHSRRFAMVKLIDKEGVIGWGEASTLDEPIYKPDYLGSVVGVLQDVLLPALLRKKSFATPQEVDGYLSFVRGHYFAKAAISIAAYDIAAQKEKKTLAAFIGASKTSVKQSETISIAQTTEAMLEQAEQLVERGFTNLKLKIGPQADIPYIEALRHRYPDLPLMVDANAAYRFSEETSRKFKTIDQLGLFAIEQPLDWNDLCDHARLQAQLKTPLALDESVDCVHDLEQALTLKSASQLNIKVSRVGGLTEALRLYEIGRKNGLGLWVGGMLEGPVGLAAVIALSAMDGFDLPADYISSHYLIEGLERYFVEQPYSLNDSLLVPNFNRSGLGFSINYDALMGKANKPIRVMA